MVKTTATFSGLASMSIAKRKRRHLSEISKRESRSLVRLRNLLVGQSGGSIDTSALDAEMINFLAEIGSITSEINWTE